MIVSPDALDVILRDGTVLRLRPPRAGDEEAMIEFMNGISQQSLYYRFHGLPTVSTTLVRPFVDPDWQERGLLDAIHSRFRLPLSIFSPS